MEGKRGGQHARRRRFGFDGRRRAVDENRVAEHALGLGIGAAAEAEDFGAAIHGRRQIDAIRIDDAHHGGHRFVTDGRVLRAEIEKRDGHGSSVLAGEGNAAERTVNNNRGQTRVRIGIGTSRPVFADS